MENKIMSIDDLAEYTGYAKGTLYNKVQKGEIPFRQHGNKKKGKLLFEKEKIDAVFLGKRSRRRK